MFEAIKSAAVAPRPARLNPALASVSANREWVRLSKGSSDYAKMERRAETYRSSHHTGGRPFVAAARRPRGPFETSAPGGDNVVDVYLVPVGRGRHALYCEPDEEAGPVSPAPGRGFWKRLTDRFSEVLAAVEREHDERSRPEHSRPSGLWARLRGRGTAWMAEKIAEQRLLWRLRGRTQVRTLFPAGLDSAQAMAILRGNLSREFDRHRWWFVVDLLGGLLGLALTPIPGPNLIGYYFTFRIVGHYFSLRGIRHGLTEVRWDLEPSAALAELDLMDGVSRTERELRVRAVAERLGLDRLPRFYERTASWTA
jgi:hypothetical protein